MSDDNTIDYETFRKTRLERFLDWRRRRALKFRAWRKGLMGGLMQCGWSETEAEVVTCTLIRNRYTGLYSKSGSGPILSGWSVTFKYVVHGKTYDGVLVSREEVEVSGKFAIRYNPENPVENNTLESELGWFDGFAVAVYDAVLILLLASLIVAGVLLRR